jgi:hypothetical protein
MTADGHAGISRTDALVDHQKDALLAAGVFRDEQVVKAEALRGAALAWDGADEGDPVSDFLHERADALLAGDPS